MQNTPEDAVSRKYVPFEGLETKIEWLDPHFAKNDIFNGTGFDGTYKIFGRKPLHNGNAHV